MNIWLAEIWRAWRASLRRPGFLVLAVCVLGLGVGASAAVFTLVDQVLLRPLPFAHAGRLVAIGFDLGTGGPIVSTRQYQHLKSLQGVTSMGLVDGGSSAVNILGDGVPQRANLLRFDRHLLPTLGVHPIIGHNFTAQEDQAHGSSVALLGHGFWERAYGGNPDVIGKRLGVKGVVHTIVGVLPAHFDDFCGRFLRGCDIVLPLALSATGSDSTIGYRVIARLAPGVTARAVGAQVNARMDQLYGSPDQLSQFMGTRVSAVTDLGTALHARSHSVLVLFMASGLCVLLIAWVNLTNLLFLRTLSRRRESALREALGATGLRRHLPAFAETLLVGLLGGLLGVALAVLGLRAFRHFVPAAWLAAGTLHPGASTWVFALLAGVIGAWSATSLGLWKGRLADLGTQLHEGGRSGADPRMGYISRALVVVQVALATVLLACAGLFLHALVDASQVRLGFNPHDVLVLELAPVKTQYPDADSILSLGKRLRQRLAAQAGVVRADVSTALPTGDDLVVMGLRVGDGESFGTHYAGVDAGYFATLSIPLLRGRVITRADLHGGERVAVVNQAFARQHLGGDALGKTLHFSYPQPMSVRVVGVVGDTRQAGPLQPALPILYVPWQQVPAPWLAGSNLRFALRVHGDPRNYRKAVRAVVAEVAPTQPISSVRSLQEMVQQTISHVWLILLLVGLFALLALLLAVAGIYAVMAVVVASREHEFGVRTALGAAPARLVRLVLRGGLLQILVGLVLGIGIAVLFSGTLRALLEQIGRSRALDPWVITGVCGVLASAGLFACLIPAMHAGRVHPMRALRGE